MGQSWTGLSPSWSARSWSVRTGRLHHLLAVISSPHFPFTDLLVVQWNSQADIHLWASHLLLGKGSIPFLTAGGTDDNTCWGCSQLPEAQRNGVGWSQVQEPALTQGCSTAWRSRENIMTPVPDDILCPAATKSMTGVLWNVTPPWCYIGDFCNHQESKGRLNRRVENRWSSQKGRRDGL